jgi:hypothetical protein
MTSTRTLAVEKGTVACLSDKRESVEKCRFCVHSVRFVVMGKEVPSPARAFCTMSRATGEVDMQTVTDVICDDLRQEGFRSIMNVIS